VFIQKDMSYVRYCSLLVGSPEPPLAAVDRRSARDHAEPPCHRQEGQHGLDNPTNFFTAQSLDSRAGDINNLLDGIGNGVQVLQAANTGITSLQKLVDTAKSIANQALQSAVGYSTKSNVSATIAGATAPTCAAPRPTPARPRPPTCCSPARPAASPQPFGYDARRHFRSLVGTAAQTAPAPPPALL
jgi:hypothetical protein